MSDASHRFAKSAMRDALKFRLLQESYTESIKEGGEVNRALKEALLLLGRNRDVELSLDVEDINIEEGDERSMPKRTMCVECLVGFITRVKDKNIQRYVECFYL